MSTKKELNNWIEQQENSKKSNLNMNKQAEVLHRNNDTQMVLIKQQNKLLEKSIHLRQDQDVAIDKSLVDYKKMIRNGEYGEENKDMKFIDEK